MRKDKRQEEAYPGDTYIKELKTGMKSKRGWLQFLMFIMIISGFADYFIMVDLVAKALDADPTDISDPVRFSTVWVLPAVLVIGYLGLGVVAGSKRKEWRTFGKRSSKMLWRISLVCEVIALVVILVVRWYLEYRDNSGEVVGGSGMDGSGIFDDSGSQLATVFNVSAAMVATYQTILLGCIMAFGAFASLVHSYYSGDVVVSEMVHSARVHLHDDAALYEQTYYEFAGNSLKDKQYESEERSFDEQELESIIRLNEIKSKLIGVLDPADSHDFIQATEDAYSATVRSS